MMMMMMMIHRNDAVVMWTVVTLPLLIQLLDEMM